jgi:hypothetical protein
MSARHIERLHTIELPSRERLLLRVLASYACDLCGFASPSPDALVAITGFRPALLELAVLELLKTEFLREVRLDRQDNTLRGYIVLPELQLELHPAPCARCQANPQPVAREA